MKISINEFHINRKLRQECNFDQTLFASSGNAIFADFKAVQKFQTLLNEVFEKRGQNENKVSAGNLNAMGLIDEIFHHVCMLFRRDKAPDAFKNILSDLDRSLGIEEMDKLLLEFMEEFFHMFLLLLFRICWRVFCRLRRFGRFFFCGFCCFFRYFCFFFLLTASLAAGGELLEIGQIQTQ